jgi:hypothetical protein
VAPLCFSTLHHLLKLLTSLTSLLGMEENIAVFLQQKLQITTLLQGVGTSLQQSD